MNAWIDWPEDREPWRPEQELRAEVPILWLDRPEVRNAMTPKMLLDLRGQVEKLTNANRAIVLAGKGDSFCAGFDLKLCRDETGALAELLHCLHHAIAALKAAPVPVVIAAHGAAVAGACALFGGADYVVTDATAKLGYPVVRLGLSPAVSAPFLAPQVAAGLMRRLMLDPGLISGEEALRVGLVHECVATPADVLPAALAAAKLRASKPRDAYVATKRLLIEIEAEQQRETSPPPAAGWALRGLDVSLASANTDETRARLAKLPLK